MRGARAGDLTATLVQSSFTAQDYRSPEAFRDKVFTLCEGIKPARTTAHLVVYPELTGLWVPLLSGRRSRSLPALAVALLLSHGPAVLGGLVTGRGLSALFRIDWRESLRAWLEPFREAARRLNAYLCPGSSLLPPFDWESRRGLHLRGPEVHNISCLISPRGSVLGWTRKIHLLRAERRLGARPGSMSELTPYHTEIGCIGILLCLDGFHEAAVQHLDRQGCRIVIQPSANPLPWTEPPRRGMTVTQEEQWLGEGLGQLIQGRENISLALNPMSVSSVLGRTEQGRSSVFVNPAKGLEVSSPSRLPEGYRSYSGLTAIASSCDTEEILSVTIPQTASWLRSHAPRVGGSSP
jgi:predicted amidohydrolase